MAYKANFINCYENNEDVFAFLIVKRRNMEPTNKLIME